MNESETSMPSSNMMTGLCDKVAQVPLSHLLKTRLEEADTPLGTWCRFGLPLDARQFYFPDLYPEAWMQVDEG